MSQLAQVPLRIILADDQQLAFTLGEGGQKLVSAIASPTRRTSQPPIRHPRAAHGKLMLLLGPESGRLIVGSGNLGYDGYASPGELWHVFAYSDDQPQHLNEFAAARSFIDGLASRQLIDPPVVELLARCVGQGNMATPGANSTPDDLQQPRSSPHRATS